MARFLTLLFVLSLALWPAAARGAAIGVSPAWYHVVTPYNYDESRRFEAGWNRGVDALAIGGKVRAVRAGVVQFSGTVAGRGIVTVRTEWNGMPVVFTYSGVTPGRVQVGERVGEGAVLGRAVQVHVGVYDVRRRSRYLPIEQAAMEAPVAGGPAGDATISGAIATRLLGAIDGNLEHRTARPAGLATSRPDEPLSIRVLNVRHLLPSAAQLVTPAGTVRRADVGGARERVPTRRPIALPVAVPVAVPSLESTAQLATSDSGAAAIAMAAAALKAGAGAAVRGGSAGAGAAGAVRGSDPRAGGAAAAVRAPRLPRGESSERADGEAMTVRSGAAASRRARTMPTHAPTTTTASDTTHPSTTNPSTVHPGTAHPSTTSPGDSTASWLPVWLSVAGLAVVLALARRRRKGSGGRAASVAAPIMPRPTVPDVLLPQPHRIASARVGHQQKRQSLACTNHHHECGTPAWSTDELLRHDADLLRELDAAPGARIHDDRRRRDHALPATQRH